MATFQVESILTDRYQTTVPKTVRRALKLGKRDKIQYTLRPGGEVVLSRAVVVEEDDPVLSQFLGFLAHDIASHPARLQVLNADLVQRIHLLVDEIELDLDARLSAEDERTPALVMSDDHYSGLMETVHLLRSPANAAHLSRSIAQLTAGQAEHRDFIEEESGKDEKPEAHR